MYSKTSNRTGANFSLKISALYAGFFIVASVGLFFTTYYLIEKSVRQDERELINAQAQEYRAWFIEGGLTALRSRFLETSGRSKELYFIRVIGPDNKALRSEEVLAGPVSALRYLRLLINSLRDLEKTGNVQLPGKIEKTA